MYEPHTLFTKICLPRPLKTGLPPPLGIFYSYPSILWGLAQICCSPSQDSLPSSLLCTLRCYTCPSSMGSCLTLGLLSSTRLWTLAGKKWLNRAEPTAIQKYFFLSGSTGPCLLAWLTSTHPADLYVGITSSGKPSSIFRSGSSVPWPPPSRCCHVFNLPQSSPINLPAEVP